MPTLNREDHAREVARLLSMPVSKVEEVFRMEDRVELAHLKQGYKVKRGKLTITEVKTRKARKRYNGLQKDMREEPEKKVIEIRQLIELDRLLEEINEES